MLAPNSRELLLDALRPDPGFVLECAVGTTFSLDLDALLLAPLAFALFDVDAGSADADPIALLAAITSYARKMAIYTDAAHICVPSKERPLMQLLESTIRPIEMPDGAFHPKVWALRYVTPDGERRHRVLVLSRNLTFDRSWDTVLRLDEDPDATGDLNGRELETFLDYLRTRKPSSVVDDLLTTIGRVSFAPPPLFDELRFWPMLANGADPMRDVGASSVLVVSPFATSGRLAQLAPDAKRRALVTRSDTLTELGGHTLAPWHEVFVLRGEAIDDDPEHDEAIATLSGLHAKLYVFDDGRKRRIFTGSANATTASLARNIELVVELSSHDASTRVDRLLGETDGTPTLRALLTPRRPESDEPVPKTAREVEADRLEALARALAAGRPVAKAQSDAAGRWSVAFTLPLGGVELAPHDKLRARLVTTTGVWQQLSGNSSEMRGDLPAGAASRVSSLVAVELAGDPHLGVAPERFVVIAELIDAPENREDQLLLDLLPDAEKLMRLLFMLLADGRDGADAAGEVRRILAGHGSGDSTPWSPQLPLFENLVRTFAREPERLQTIRGVIDKMRTAPDGLDRFPPGFLELWSTFERVLPKKAGA
ncbi:hypothetical protein DSM112329_04758 [Paraconexibacter sp. AEG42_29]|uniref:PLD phosphodiesterase domain-containing protein n=1 Tax=Paraconexibacter sp. AEG42_29 TaxID=2997339 RepID=A0AAU7B1W8_9ACTN